MEVHHTQSTLAVKRSIEFCKLVKPPLKSDERWYLRCEQVKEFEMATHYCEALFEAASRQRKGYSFIGYSYGSGQEEGNYRSPVLV